MAGQNSTGLASVTPIKSAKSAATSGPMMLVVIIAVIIGTILLVGRKHEEVWDNPLVDLVVISVGVAAVWSLGRYVGNKTGVPGMTAFFGGKSA